MGSKLEVVRTQKHNSLERGRLRELLMRARNAKKGFASLVKRLNAGSGAVERSSDRVRKRIHVLKLVLGKLLAKAKQREVFTKKASAAAVLHENRKINWLVQLQKQRVKELVKAKRTVLKLLRLVHRV